MLKELPPDEQLLFLALCIVAGLLLIALVRMLLLSRSNRRMRQNLLTMDRQTQQQGQQITAMHHGSMSWRAGIQRQFDAFSAFLSQRLIQAGQDCQQAQTQLEAAQSERLTHALAKIAALEARLAARAAPAAPPIVASLPDLATTPKPAGMTKLPPPSLPALPAMETLRLQSLENELAAAKAEIAAGKRHNAVLHQALLTARRKQTLNLRKNSGRGKARPL